jgi:DNA-3-methyladenine glycosylase
VDLTRLIERAILPRDTVGLATFLIGKLVVRTGMVPESPAQHAIVRIVETEAYPPGDEAAHHYRRMTARNRSLFLDRGHAYVYRAYGTCWMLNVSSETEGVGAGVLIRAGAPEVGLALMACRRGAVPARDVARGPGRLARALDIDHSFDGVDLCRPGTLFLANDDRPVGPIGIGTRIGITRAADRKLRFFLRDSRFVSGPAWLNRLP